jgi:hypothetical protein
MRKLLGDTGVSAAGFLSATGGSGRATLNAGMCEGGLGVRTSDCRPSFLSSGVTVSSGVSGVCPTNPGTTSIVRTTTAVIEPQRPWRQGDAMGGLVHSRMTEMVPLW